MIDLTPATEELARLVAGVTDDQLTAPTPCRGENLADLLDHVDGLCLAFTAGAQKRSLPGGAQGQSPDGSRLGTDWRTRIPERLADLAKAWQDDAAWTGTATVGGVTSPGETNGMFALDEVIVHGWDIAVASVQPLTVDPDLLEATFSFVRETVARQPQGIPGLFGPALRLPAGEPLLDRLLGLTGRDPAWTPGPSGAGASGGAHR